MPRRSAEHYSVRVEVEQVSRGQELEDLAEVVGAVGGVVRRKRVDGEAGVGSVEDWGLELGLVGVDVGVDVDMGR